MNSTTRRHETLHQGPHHQPRIVALRGLRDRFHRRGARIPWISLSVLAIQSGSEVVWDPKAYRIVSPDALNSKLTHEIRGAWAQS